MADFFTDDVEPGPIRLRMNADGIFTLASDEILVDEAQFHALVDLAKAVGERFNDGSITGSIAESYKAFLEVVPEHD